MRNKRIRKKEKKRNRISISEKEEILLQKDVIEKMKKIHEEKLKEKKDNERQKEKEKREKKMKKRKQIKYILGTVFSLTVLTVEIILIFI